MFGPEVSHVRCYKCDAEIWMRAARLAQLRENRETFHCPNGHAQSFTGPTEAERQLERERALRANAELRAVEAERCAQRLEKAARAKKCPHCGRTFDGERGLATHITRMHAKARRQLPASAGPNAHGRDYAKPS